MKEVMINKLQGLSQIKASLTEAFDSAILGAFDLDTSTRKTPTKFGSDGRCS